MHHALDLQDWLAALSYFLTFGMTLARTELLSPRISYGPSASYGERLAHDALAFAAGLRGWLVFAGDVEPSGSEVTLAVCLAVVAAKGLIKLVWSEAAERFGLVLAGWLRGG